MVIQCPACQTRFRIADDRIGANGVQVRCSKCTNTFPVLPTDSSAARGELSGKFPAAEAKPSTPGDAGWAPSPIAANTPSPLAGSGAPGTPPGGFALGPEGFAPAGGASLESAFASSPLTETGTPSALDGWGAAPTAEGAVEPGDTASGFRLPEKPVLGTDHVEHTPEPGADPFSNGSTGEDGSSATFDQNLKSSLLAGVSGSAPAAPPDATPSRGKEIGRVKPISVPASILREESLELDGGPKRIKPSGSTESAEAIPKGPRPADFRAREDAKKKRAGAKTAAAEGDEPQEPRAVYRIVLGLAVAGTVAATFASLTNGTFAPSNADASRIVRVLGREGSVPGMTLTPRSGTFLETTPGHPRVFVARGIARNGGHGAQGMLQVRGRLRDESGATLAESTVPCGNQFAEEKLRQAATADEIHGMYLPIGDNGSNARIDAGATIGCNVVFFDAPVPDRIASYELELVSARPAS